MEFVLDFHNKDSTSKASQQSTQLQRFAKFMTVDVSNYITSFYGLGIFLNFYV